MEKPEKKKDRTPKEVLRDSIDDFAAQMKGRMGASDLEAIAKAVDIHDGLACD